MQIPDDLQMDPPTSECRDGPGLLLNWLCWLWRCLCARARSLAHGLSLFRVFLITPLCNNNPPLASTKMNKCSKTPKKKMLETPCFCYISDRSYIRYQILSRSYKISDPCTSLASVVSRSLLCREEARWASKSGEVREEVNSIPLQSGRVILVVRIQVQRVADTSQ
jgi:hypothetical protein